MRGVRLIIHSLSPEDQQGFAKTFKHKFDKIARLYDLLLDNQRDEVITKSLGISANAYSTLRSRLQKKIQDYLVSKSKSPKIDVLKKMLNLDEFIFSQKRSVVLATLKKLESELKRYDLAKELITIYHHLKNLHINTPDYFKYSKLYNRQVAHSLALEKAEDLLANYFDIYGRWFVMQEEPRILELQALSREMKNVCSLYDSHRMNVYRFAMEAFHRMFVDSSIPNDESLLPLEDWFDEIARTFEAYKQDSLYRQLGKWFLFLKLEYYLKHKIWAKANSMYEQVADDIPQLLEHYSGFTFPAQILLSRIQLALFNDAQDKLYEWDMKLFPAEYQPGSSTSQQIIYFVCRSLACYYKGNLDKAYRWLFNLNNEVGFKENLTIALEVKCLMAFIKVLQKDSVLFNQNFISAQRTLRQIGKENAGHLQPFMKILSIANSRKDSGRVKKVETLLQDLSRFTPERFKPTLLITWDAHTRSAFEKPILIYKG